MVADRHLWRLNGKMTDRDIWLAANLMIKLFGDDAALYAALRAGAVYDPDAEDDYEDWKRIALAIDELGSAEPWGALN
jgi:hypothetical protein